VVRESVDRDYAASYGSAISRTTLSYCQIISLELEKAEPGIYCNLIAALP
jgi:hypothetical protein